MSKRTEREVVESIPHKTVQPELPSPFTEILNAGGFVPSHVRADLPPQHDILGIHCTGIHFGGAGAVEIGEAKRPSSHVGVEIAPSLTKDVRKLRVCCQPFQLRGLVVVRSAMVKDSPRWNSRGSYGMSYLGSSARWSEVYWSVTVPAV